MKNNINILILGFILGFASFLYWYRIDISKDKPIFTYVPMDKIPTELDLCKNALVSWEKKWKGGRNVRNDSDSCAY